jgi:multiple sugar transport system permease protein
MRGDPDRRWRSALWVLPWVAGFAVFMALPIVLSAVYSFTDYSLLESPVFIGTANYRELFGDALFHRTMMNTAVYALASVTLGTVVAIGLALLLRHPTPRVAFTRAAVFLPTLVPVVAATLGWGWMLNGEHGLVNAALGVVGVHGPDWLGDVRWALSALVLISLWQVGGATVIYIAALQDVPRSLEEAAAIDGAGRLGLLRHVTLPMISPAILFNVVTAVIWSLQVFVVPYILTKGGPENATYFYTMYLYDNAFVYGRMGYACAMGWLQFIAIVVLTALLFRLSRRFVHYRLA